jgi:hypothetical protein
MDEKQDSPIWSWHTDSEFSKELGELCCVVFMGTSRYRNCLAWRRFGVAVLAVHPSWPKSFRRIQPAS